MVDGLSTVATVAALFSRDLQGSVQPQGATGSASARRVGTRPQLLVSVRDVAEASAALAGGAEIIDVKEPTRGPLGMADVDVIADVIRFVSDLAPVSAALGELRDWLKSPGATGSVSASSEAANAIPPLPFRLSFAKLGLAHMSDCADWISNWLEVRHEFEAAAGSPLTWVAVGYADAEAAGAPSVEEIIDAASQTGCRGVLIDTWDKTSGSLLELLSPAELQCLRTQAHGYGLLFAVAGRLRASDLHCSEIRNADVIGVRSAACERSDRRGKIAAESVRSLQDSLRRTEWPSVGRLTAARS